MIDREERDEVVVLRLRHGKVSALDLELLTALSEALKEVEEAGGRAVVLTGTGRSFSAGVDLPRVLDGGRPYLEEFLPRLSETLLDLVRYPRPVVAAVNGHAIAGGLIVACACDRRVLAAGPAKLGVTELEVGVAFPTVALELVRATAGRWASEMVFGAGLYDGDRALAMGLVDEIVASEDLIDRAVESARKMARIPAGAFAATKAALRAPLLEAIAAHGEAVGETILEAWTSSETREAMRRFVERTLSRN